MLKKWWNFISGIIRAAANDPNAWEASIREFEKLDRLQPPEPGSILFVGSSTFTLWATLERDMYPLRVINRGFGGAKLTDIIVYFQRIAVPYKPSVIVLFAGTNEVAGPKPATAQRVYQGYLDFVVKVERHLPGTRIYYLAITPTPSRWKYWRIAKEANKLIEEYTKQDETLQFIDPTAKFIGPDGRPDRKFYRMDRLHPNKLGYVILMESIKQVLESDLVQP